jgi:uncharacterized protein YjbI with pentapeptide repeats
MADLNWANFRMAHLDWANLSITNLMSLAMAKSPEVAEVVADVGQRCPPWWPTLSPIRVADLS